MRGADEKLKELDEKQQAALAALLAEKTIAAAAKRAKLGEATLYRYLADPVFKACYRDARAEIVDHAVTQLQRDCVTASATLRAVCGDKEAPASARVSAAKTILEGAIKGVELQDLTARLEAVERNLPPKKGTR